MSIHNNTLRLKGLKAIAEALPDFTYGDYSVSENDAGGETYDIEISTESGGRLGRFIQDKLDVITADDFGDATEVPRYFADNKQSLKRVQLPEGITAIRASAFEGCRALEEINLPSSLTTIEPQAFYNNHAIEKLTIPESVSSIGASFGSLYSLIELNYNAISVPDFNSNQRPFTGLGYQSNGTYRKDVKIKIGNKVKRIPAYTFGKSSSSSNLYVYVTDLIFEDNSVCTTVGNDSFNGCKKLTNIVIPNSVTNIGAYAFAGCSELTNVSLPMNLTTLGAYAFQSTKLNEIRIPKTITTINAGLFNNCKSLAICDFSNHESVPTLSNTNAFTSVPSTCEIRVPAALYDEWVAATNWSTYASQIVAV